MTQRHDYFTHIAYMLNELLHRTDGPARIWNASGDWGWYLYGMRHRYYGPSSRAGHWFLHDRGVKWCNEL